MGYHWRLSADGKCPRQAKPYDTEALGSLNKGHDSIETLGMNWAENEAQLNELLEYLKTL